VAARYDGAEVAVLPVGGASFPYVAG